MTSANNYAKMEEHARNLFLSHDQEEILRTWRPEHDDDYFYFTYIGRRYRLCRRTAVITPVSGSENEVCESVSDGEDFLTVPGTGGAAAKRPDTFGVSLALFDLLSRGGPIPARSGEWKLTSAFAGAISSGHDPLLSNMSQAAELDHHLPALRRRLQELGGEPMDMGDVSFVIPVIELPSLQPPLRVWVQFWSADEDFPASLRFLWEASMTQFLHYETLWYVMTDVISDLKAHTIP